MLSRQSQSLQDIQQSGLSLRISVDKQFSQVKTYELYPSTGIVKGFGVNKAEKKFLIEYLEVNELIKQDGIYLLFDQMRVSYVGISQKIKARLNNHASKRRWDRVIVFYSTRNNINPNINTFAKKGRERIGFSGKVVSVTTSPSQKTHERNYSTDYLSCTASFRNNSAAASTHDFCLAVPFRSGDDARTVALERDGGQLSHLTALHADAVGLGAAAVDGRAGASAQTGRGVCASGGRSGGEQSGQDNARLRTLLFQSGTASHSRTVVFGTVAGRCAAATVVSAAGGAAFARQAG
jgi:hypothetical protein